MGDVLKDQIAQSQEILGIFVGMMDVHTSMSHWHVVMEFLYNMKANVRVVR